MYRDSALVSGIFEAAFRKVESFFTIHVLPGRRLNNPTSPPGQTYNKVL